MTGLIRMTHGERWEFNGLALRFERELGDEFLHFLVERTLAPFQIETDEGRSAPTWDWVRHQLAANTLRRVGDRRGPLLRQQAAKLEYDAETIAKLDARAAMRAFILRELDKLGSPPRSDRQLRHALAQIWANHPEKLSEYPDRPYPRTVRRWLDERGEPGERRLRDMLSMSGRVPRKRRFPPETITLMQRYALWYWTRRGWRQIDAYARFDGVLRRINKMRTSLATRQPQLKIPSRQTFEKEIHRVECLDTFTLKYGKRLAELRFKASGPGLSADRFLRLGCMDHTILDGVAILDSDWLLPIGRPTITIIIDVYTRCIVGIVISFEPPSLYSVTECIKRANQPKIGILRLCKDYPVLQDIFGNFDEIIVDNGKEFTGTSLEDGMMDIGTSVRFAPVASPTYKAPAERFFRTLRDIIVDKLPGATLPPALMREMGYDPAKDAVLTLDQIEKLIWEAISLYHIEVHSGVGAPPALLWQQQIAAHGIPTIADIHALDKMLGAVKKSCRVTRSGVKLFDLRFHHPRRVEGLLEDLIYSEARRTQPRGSASIHAKVKYNPANLSEIQVWNAKRKVYVTLPCTDETYSSGISLWHHRKLREWADNRNLAFSSEADRLAARAALIDLIYAAAPGMRGKAKRDMRRLLNSPKVQDLGGGAMIAYAEPRHDGMAAIIPHDTLAGERTDGGLPSSRPARPRKAGAPKPRAASKPKKLDSKTIYDAGDVIAPNWKEVEL